MNCRVKIENIDLTLFIKQKMGVLNSNMPNDLKDGLLNLLDDMQDQMESPEFWTSVSIAKEDIIASIFGGSFQFDFTDKDEKKEYELIKAKVDELTSSDMDNIAKELQDSLVNENFWDALEGITKEKYFTDEWKKKFIGLQKYADDIDDVN